MASWLSVLFLLLGIYLLISILLYFLQDRLLFKPEKLPEAFQYEFDKQEVEEYNLITAGGGKINGLHFKVKNPKGVVLYLKGNSKSIKGWGKFAIDFSQHHYDVIMVDYRGFGKSTGKRTEKLLKKDLQYVYEKIKERVDERYIILYGRSLGSGFAAKLASTNQPKLLILDAPYYSLKHVTKRYAPFMPLSIILKYPMPTYKWLKYVNCPIHIIHGTQDRLIPFSSSVKLSQIKADSTRLWPVVGGGHKNLNTFKSYHQILDEIIEGQAKEIDWSNTSHQVNHNSENE